MREKEREMRERERGEIKREIILEMIMIFEKKK